MVEPQYRGTTVSWRVRETSGPAPNESRLRLERPCVLSRGGPASGPGCKQLGLPFPSFQDTLSECVIRPGGLNRSAVGKTEISFTSRRPQQLAPPTPTLLLACTIALCRAILRHDNAWRRPWPACSLRGRPTPFPGRAPYLSIQSTLKPKVCPSRLRPPSLHPQGRRRLS